MESNHNCACGHRCRHLIIPLILLMISSFTNARIIMVPDRAISKLIINSANSLLNYAPNQRVEEAAMGRRYMIGSRPPRCERKCNSCEHCEPVQVPIVSLIKPHSIAIPNSRGGGDISNYKPICWKCKCGNSIFNP